jgi:DNA-binding PadR family transcriptional regulator
VDVALGRPSARGSRGGGLATPAQFQEVTSRGDEKMAKSEIIVLKRALLKSPALRSLNSTSMLVYLDFLSKRKMQKHSRRPGRKPQWYISNNGEIEYTYSEAEKKGISRPRFMRALDNLVEKGFIDITHSGSGGVKGDKSKYAISERWLDYGTDKFIKKTRPKDSRNGRGWAAYWAKRRREGESMNKVVNLEKRRFKKKRPKIDISKIRRKKIKVGSK